MTYDQWFKSQQGIPYDGSYLFAEAAWEEAQRQAYERAADIADANCEDEPYGHAKFRCVNIATAIRAMIEVDR